MAESPEYAPKTHSAPNFEERPRKLRVLHKLNVILSLRRIRDPSARRDELRILRLRSQARFAQDDSPPEHVNRVNRSEPVGCQTTARKATVHANRLPAWLRILASR